MLIYEDFVNLFTSMLFKCHFSVETPTDIISPTCQHSSSVITQLGSIKNKQDYVASYYDITLSILTQSKQFTLSGVLLFLVILTNIQLGFNHHCFEHFMSSAW